MSTRSVIAVPRGDGWVGTYCHFDGYPEAMLPTLQEIINREGGAKAASVLVGGNGWSSIDTLAGTPERDDRLNPENRYLAIPGYGYAYSVRDRMGLMTESTADPLFIEWVYVLRGDEIEILESHGPEQERLDPSAYDWRVWATTHMGLLHKVEWAEGVTT